MPQTTELIPAGGGRPMLGRSRRAPLRERPAPRGRGHQQVNLNLVIPLTPLLWLFSPLVLLALPVVNAVIIARRMDPRTVSLALSALPALSGLEVDVHSPEARVRVRFL